jgi:hypothetical protein
MGWDLLVLKTSYIVFKLLSTYISMVERLLKKWGESVWGGGGKVSRLIDQKNGTKTFVQKSETAEKQRLLGRIQKTCRTVSNRSSSVEIKQSFFPTKCYTYVARSQQTFFPEMSIHISEYQPNQLSTEKWFYLIFKIILFTLYWRKILVWKKSSANSCWVLKGSVGNVLQGLGNKGVVMKTATFLLIKNAS